MKVNHNPYKLKVGKHTYDLTCAELVTQKVDQFNATFYTEYFRSELGFDCVSSARLESCLYRIQDGEFLLHEQLTERLDNGKTRVTERANKLPTARAVAFVTARERVGFRDIRELTS